MDGVGSKARRSGMEPRNRGGNTPPQGAGRGWAVEGRRVGGPVDGMVWGGARRDRFIRAIAAMSTAPGGSISRIEAAQLAAMVRRFPTLVAEPAEPSRSVCSVRRVS